MHIGKGKSGGMGKRRDFGLTGGSGKGDKTRTNLAGKAWQKNYDAIFRPTPKRRKVTMADKIVRAVAKELARQHAQPLGIL